jgi:hypothetical protein
MGSNGRARASRQASCHMVGGPSGPPPQGLFAATAPQLFPRCSERAWPHGLVSWHMVYRWLHHTHRLRRYRRAHRHCRTPGRTGAEPARRQPILQQPSSRHAHSALQWAGSWPNSREQAVRHSASWRRCSGNPAGAVATAVMPEPLPCIPRRHPTDHECVCSRHLWWSWVWAVHGEPQPTGSAECVRLGKDGSLWYLTRMHACMHACTRCSQT